MRARHLLLVVALALAVVGCKKAKPGPAAGAAPLGALAAIPSDATLVIGLDIAKLKDSGLVARALSDLFVRDPELAARFERLAADCGVDVTTQVKAVHLAMAPSAAGAARRALLIATGELAEASLTRCLQAGIGAGGGDVTVKQSGARSLYKLTEGRRTVFFGFGKADTVVVGPDEDWVVSALGEGPKVETSPALGKRLADVDKTAAIWFVALMDPALGAKLVANTNGAIGAPPSAVWAELEPIDGLTLHVGFDMTTNADASALVGFAKTELMIGGMAAQHWALGPIVGKVEVAAKGARVHFRVQLSDDELKDVLAAVDSGSTGSQDAPPSADGGLDSGPSPNPGDAGP